MSQRRIASLERATRIWAIPAIHGAAERLARVHDQIWPELEPGDRVVYLGNLIGGSLAGKGPEGGGRDDGAADPTAIRATLDELLDFRRAVIAMPGAFACHVVYLRGSQEVMWQQLLQLQFTPDPVAALNWMAERGVRATLEAYDFDVDTGIRAARAGTVALTRWTGQIRRAMQQHPGHAELLGRLHDAAESGSDGALFVHTGLSPDRPLDRQGDLFWWHGGGFKRLTRAYDGYARVVRGYDPDGGSPSAEPHKLSLDRGCGRGGPLQAACLDTAGRMLGTVEG
jgi:serine/threonine protein phosphatase 1